jgi:hypothetical protein
VTVLAADTAGWIAAIAAIVAAIATPIAWYTVFKRFRPKFQARIDARRQAIRLDVVNKGRAKGRIRKAAAIDETLVEQKAQYGGLKDGVFYPIEVPGKSTRFLIIEASEESGPFPEGVHVLVAWGSRKERQLTLEPTDNVSYYGMKSDWPK